jgi:hypothetical protein
MIYSWIQNLLSKLSYLSLALEIHRGRYGKNLRRYGKPMEKYNGKTRGGI